MQEKSTEGKIPVEIRNDWLTLEKGENMRGAADTGLADSESSVVWQVLLWVPHMTSTLAALTSVTRTEVMGVTAQ